MASAKRLIIFQFSSGFRIFLLSVGFPAFRNEHV